MVSKINKKRIIFFLPNFNRGGASESILKLAKFLVNHNFSIMIISLNKNFYKRELIKIGCDVFEIHSKRVSFAIFKLRKLIKSEISKNHDKTILISNIHYANIISIISCFNLDKIKIILTERSSITELRIFDNFFKYLKNRLIFFLAKYFYKFADLIITNSQFEKNFIKSIFSVKKIMCIYPPSISHVKKSKQIKNNLNFVKIIYVGRLSKEKGVITILRALTLLKKYKFILKIYGDGSEKENLQKFINLNKLQKKVVFKGFVKNKDIVFKDADLFINASWFEGLPNALVQSINNSIYPIVSRSPGGNFEVIKHGKLGLSFKSNDANDLKNKILFFLKNKIKLNQKLRINHMNNFTEKKSNINYLKILDKI